MKMSDILQEYASVGSTSVGNIAGGPMYPSVKATARKNKDGTVKNALDMKDVSPLTGGTVKRTGK